MILITTFVRIFSIIHRKMDDIIKTIDPKCSSDWSQQSDKYIKEIMEQDLHARYKKSFICGLVIIHSFCQHCANRGFTGNLPIDYMQHFRLCPTHAKKIDDFSTISYMIQLLDIAPQGWKLLYILQEVWARSYECTKCTGNKLLSSDFFERNGDTSDCSTCELLVLDSIFPALLYTNAPRRMFATLAIDEPNSTPNYKATAHKVGLTRWRTSVWDVLFISGYHISVNDLFKRWLQSILKYRQVRSFFIYFELQNHKSGNLPQRQRYCTEPQIQKYIKKTSWRGHYCMYMCICSCAGADNVS